MDEDIQRRIREKIGEIEEKSANGNYIYRGEPETHEGPPYYGKVSSSLWRKIAKELSKKGVDIEIINTKFVQIGMLSSVKNYANETTGEGEFEIMGQLQHYGGKTNLIDFTTDYLRALFFACDGSPNEDGRVILLQRNEETDKKYQIDKPQNPINRVIAQKSIFVQPPEGFIEIKPDDEIKIPKCLKQPMLDYLRKYHDISTETIYNDLHGFIKHQEIHHRAYIDFYIGLSYQFKRDFDDAIDNFNKATKQNPHFAEAYYYRGSAYLNKHKYCCAITDLKEAIRLNSNYEEAYNVRGLVYHHIGKYECAIKDFDKAIKLNSDYADAYNNRGASYREKGKPNRAIEDCTRAIALKPDYADAYYNRGITRLHLVEWKEAKTDLTTAKANGGNIIDIFHNNYESIEVFEEKYGIQLPADIAELLTPTQA